MVCFRALAQRRLFDFDEITDLRLFAKHRAGPQPREGSDFDTLADHRPFDMAERVDHHFVGDRDAGAEEDVRLDHDVTTDNCIISKPDGLRRDQRCTIGHRLHTAALLPFAFHRRKFGAAVDTGHIERIGLDDSTHPAIGIGDIDDVDEVIFTC